MRYLPWAAPALTLCNCSPRRSLCPGGSAVAVAAWRRQIAAPAATWGRPRDSRNCRHVSDWFPAQILAALAPCNVAPLPAHAPSNPGDNPQHCCYSILARVFAKHWEPVKQTVWESERVWEGECVIEIDTPISVAVLAIKKLLAWLEFWNWKSSCLK